MPKGTNSIVPKCPTERLDIYGSHFGLSEAAFNGYLLAFGDVALRECQLSLDEWKGYRLALADMDKKGVRCDPDEKPGELELPGEEV